jgi:hypothetical protein
VPFDLYFKVSLVGRAQKDKVRLIRPSQKGQGSSMSLFLLKLMSRKRLTLLGSAVSYGHLGAGTVATLTC